MPFRNSAQRSTFALFLLLAAGIMLIGKADPTLYERSRMAVTDFATPILDTVSHPVAAGGEFIIDLKLLYAAHEENRALREENERLLRWRAVAESLESENARLRGMLNFAPDAPARYITGRVIGDSGGAFLRSVLVNIGHRDGVRKGAAAVEDSGLMGRVAEVGERSSRILLVSDLNSRIPVLVGESRERAILAGDNSDRPKLAYLPAEISIAPGDLVITSGHGGAFPAGLPVGVVVRPDTDEAELRVQPFYSAQRLEFVRLMDFGLTGVLQDRDLGLAGR
ncbi:MAG: rod shape-determining protein MreC [Rhodospirillales bacterium]|nr:MAG: rod shape-determining protein MreC [Rhodospirillales bacterium]